jgi:hypothetical protein
MINSLNHKPSEYGMLFVKNDEIEILGGLIMAKGVAHRNIQ